MCNVTARRQGSPIHQHGVSYQLTIGLLLGLVLGFSFRVLVLGLSFRV